MSASAQEMLDGLREKQSAQDKLNDLRQTQGAIESGSGRSVTDVLGDNIARPFNKGLLNTINFPIDLSNAIMSMFTDARIPGADELRATSENLGMTSPAGEEAEGILPRGMEFLGASVLPGSMLQSHGRQVLNQVVAPTLKNVAGKKVVMDAGVPVAQRTVPQYLTSQTAANPAATLVGDVIGSFSGATGGEIAQEYTDDPGTIATAELAAGLGIPALTAAAPRIATTIAEKLPLTGAAIRAGKTIKDSFSTPGRQVNRVRELSADPEQAAARIDSKSPVSPLRQTEEPRLIALEEQMLREAPAPQAQAHRKKVAEAQDKAVQNARRFSGDKDAARDVLKQKSKDQVARVTARAEKALDDANKAIAELDSGASPRDISRVERDNLEDALQKARKSETEVWNQVDQDAVAGAKHTQAAMKTLKKAESDIVLKDLIPKQVRSLLSKYKKSLKKPKEGEKAVKFTMKDLQSVRSAIGDRIRKLRADGEWNKARILGKFHTSLLADMSDVDSAGIEAARAYSRSLNEKFTQGEVGKLLKLGDSGIREVDAPETLSKLLSGQSVSRGIQQFIKAAPGSRDSISEFIKNRFVLEASDPSGSINQATARRVIARLKSQGVFEEFPELEAQMLNAAKASSKAANYQKRVELVRKRGGARLEQDSNESLASTFLKKPVGKETEVLLTATNPEQLAKKLIRTMHSNPNAEKGVRRSFAEVLLNKGGGEDVPNGKAYGKLIEEHIKTLQALGFSPTQITRMRRSAAILKQLQLAGEKGAVKSVMEDLPAWFLRDPFKIIGAKVGAKVAEKTGGGGAGVSLQAAQLGSSRFEKVLNFITRDHAKAGLIDAIDDKALMKAMLLGQKAPKAEQDKAAKVLETWLYGLGVDVASEQAQEASEP